MVLDVVHGRGDTILVSDGEGGSHNWVQAVAGNVQAFLPQKIFSEFNKGTEQRFNLGFFPETKFLDTGVASLPLDSMKFSCTW